MKRRVQLSVRMFKFESRSFTRFRRRIDEKKSATALGKRPYELLQHVGFRGRIDEKKSAILMSFGIFLLDMGFVCLFCVCEVRCHTIVS